MKSRYLKLMWAASAVVVLAGSCILARPSGPDITDEHRESRAASGFKYETSPHRWAYLTSTFIPKYMRRDITPLLRHSTTPPSLHLPSNSWFHHSSADHHRLEPNNYLTEHHPSFGFGLPLFKMSPPTSNFYMFFNGRLSAPKPIMKERKDMNTRFAIAPNMYNTQPLLNSLPHERHHPMQNTVEESNVQNTVLLQSRPSQSEDVESENNEVAAVSRTEVQNNIHQIGTTNVTSHVLPEVTLNIVGNTYDVIPTAVMNSQADKEHLSVLQRTMESVLESSRDEIKPSEQGKPTTLIVKPVAKAIAGANGIAIAAPLSRAVVRKGQEVKIHFDPEAVAVVGPGGFADAHSDLLVSYYEDLPSQENE
ncbi:uncharacterized protein LOC111874400 isoform X3 [Cryptotermes secundus]|uniref:uncharacterized protein LOC111874400 isoform X3 n=1 Tax=Cryptotermes secundus TaxID=105785 RepID=UPI000CD7B11B|nr:uncharacterized protein LOC111874400 isoform X3 [Cryptotermes secundus]